MSRSVVQALSPFALASAVCALGTVLLPIETKGRALLVSWRVPARTVPDWTVPALLKTFHLLPAKHLRTTARTGT